MKDYSGVVLTAPISLGYARQSPHGAAWFVGSVLREMIRAAGINKVDIDGISVSSFSLGIDSAVASHSILACVCAGWSKPMSGASQAY